MSRFIVLSLPRSRSFWVSRFLSTHEVEVHHDPGRFMQSRDEAVAYLNQDVVAAVDTGLLAVWPHLLPRLPKDLTVVALYRPVPEILLSLKNLGIRLTSEQEDRLWEAALSLLALDGHHFSAGNLSLETEARRFYETCWGAEMPRGRWGEMHGQNLQADIFAYKADMAANQAGIRTLLTGIAA
jgi:hypothetical protein